MSDEQATGNRPGASASGGLAGAGISGGMAGIGSGGAALGGGATGETSDALAGGDNLGGGGTVGGSAVSSANSAGASTADMTEGGGLDSRTKTGDDPSGDIDNPLPDQTASRPAGSQAGQGAGGVMTGAVSDDRTGSGLGGGTSPGGPLDLGY